MKRIIIKIIVLFLVFAGSLCLFVRLMDTGESRSTKGVDDPTLPVISIQYEGTDINNMFGYAQEMDISTLRESLTLVPFDRNITFCISDHGSDISGVSYSVYSLVDDSLLENGRIKSFETDGDVRTASLHIDNPVTMGQEYMLRFEIELTGGRSYYYYTRIVQRNGQNLSWYIDYTEGFYQNCLQKNITDEMYDQLEPDTTEANSSLHSVNIHSDTEQITWGNLSPSLVKKAVPTILEVNETTVSIGLEYVISSADDDGNTEYYNVSEFYRMRRDQDKVILLDFERTCDQYFDGSLQVLTDSGLDLGITGKDISFTSDNEAYIAAFIENGELWEYNRSTNKASRVFSFNSGSHTDERCEHKGYGIKISNVSDSGDVTFVVYGYMNSGVHEGCCGISFQKYDQDDNTTEELLFIPSDQSFDMLKRNISRLAYINDSGQCFLCYGDGIISVSLEDQNVYVVQDGLDWDNFSVSDSQGIVAWTKVSESGVSTINELDLNTGETLEITAPDDEQIIIEGFLGEDVIYGLMKNGENFTDETGTEVYPMYRICLMNSDGEIIKNYQQDGIYVYSVVRDGSLLTLQRYTVSDGGRVPVSDDTIVYYEVEKNNTVSVKLAVNERKGTEVALEFTASGQTSSILTVYSRLRSDEAAPVVRLEDPERLSDVYYVYAKGKLYGIYSEVNKAIEAANDQVGVVLNCSQQYVWERGNYKTSNVIDISTIPSGLLSAPVDEESFINAVGDKYTVWNLSGCSLDSIKYQLSSGYAVTGKWSDTENVLILGYDQYDNIWIYDAQTNSSKAVALEDASAAFAAQGNIFMSYHV